MQEIVNEREWFWEQRRKHFFIEKAKDFKYRIIPGDVLLAEIYILGDEEVPQDMEERLLERKRRYGVRCNKYGVCYPKDNLTQIERKVLEYLWHDVDPPQKLIEELEKERS